MPLNQKSLRFTSLATLLVGLVIMAPVTHTLAMPAPFFIPKKKAPTKPKPKPSEPVAAQVASAPVFASTNSQTNIPPPPQAQMTKKAGPADRAAVLRMDALAQAAFWNDQFSQDPKDYEAGIYLANALRALGRYKNPFKQLIRPLH